MRSLFAREEKTSVQVNVVNLSSESEGLVKAMNRSLAMIQFDIQGNVLDANENFLRAMGYTLEEVKGRHHRIFVEPAEATGRYP